MPALEQALISLGSGSTVSSCLLAWQKQMVRNSKINKSLRNSKNVPKGLLQPQEGSVSAVVDLQGN